MSWSREEINMFELKQELAVLKQEINHAEQWIEYAKESILAIQDLIDKTEEKR